MSIYSFSGTSSVAEVRFRVADDRAPEATLAAGQNVNAALLSSLRESMLSRGWQAVPVHVDGKDQLQVSGFKTETDLVDFLRDNQALIGEPNISYADEEKNEKPKTSKNTLKAAGLLNLVGDVLLLGAGHENKDPLMMTAGGLYTGGALTLARYGTVNTDRQMKHVSGELGGLLQKQIGTMSSSTALSSAAQFGRGGTFGKAETFLYRNPANVMLAAYTGGAAAMLASGVKSGNKSGIGYGAWSLAVKASSLLIPEKKAKPSEEEKKNGGVAKGIADWIHEKPLRVFGYGSLVTEVLLGATMYTNYKKSLPGSKERRGAWLGFGTTGAYIISDILMAISSKDPTNAGGKFDAEQQRRIEAMAAEAISQAPKGEQEALIKNTAAFMENTPEITGNQHDIADSIRRQVQHMEKNPWAARAQASQWQGLQLNR